MTRSRLPEPGQRDFTGRDATNEVEALFDTARKNSATAADIDTKRAELDATLAVLRKLRGLTQADLAEALGVTQSSVSQFELNSLQRMRIETLQTVGDAMGYTTKVVFEDPDSGDSYIVVPPEK